MNELDDSAVIVLFGSRARGTSTVASDVDIAVVASKKLSALEEHEITRTTARKFGVSQDRVELVECQTASPLLNYQIARHGKVLTGSKTLFDAFRIRAWKQYLDTARLRKARHERLSSLYLSTNTTQHG